MRMVRRRSIARLALPVAASVLLSACGGGGGSSTGSDGDELSGVFRIDPGECSGTSTAGSFFRMVQPGGEPGKGPYVTNTDSSCKDQTWTPLAPGTSGGLSTVAYESNPAQAFNQRG